MVKVNAPAKINLFLDILGKLEGGFHSLFMIMQAVSLSDEITVQKTDKNGIFLTCSDERLPQDEHNIAYKAAAAFFEYTKIEPCVSVNVEKRIPFAAGLAGGSADAAGVIVGLDRLFGTELPLFSLCEIGARVGSDVPFCITGGTCLSQNRGEVLAPLKPLKDCFIVLAKPSKGVSTAEAYAAADSTQLYHPDCLKMLEVCANGDFDAICSNAGNVFEQVIEVPERVEIKRIMRSHAAKLCQMSGSGPTVFGIFDNEENAKASASEIQKICPEVFVTKPFNCGAKVID